MVTLLLHISSNMEISLLSKAQLILVLLTKIVTPLIGHYAKLFMHFSFGPFSTVTAVIVHNLQRRK